MIEDVVVGLKDAVGEPVVPEEVPDALDRVESGHAAAAANERDIARDGEVSRAVPSGLIEQRDGCGQTSVVSLLTAIHLVPVVRFRFLKARFGEPPAETVV